MSGKKYDVVIIGGGLGGLLCAVILAKEGRKVCVLEKNRQIGGCLQTFALQKKVFDACVHYIGGLGEGHTLHRIMEYAGIMDDLPLHPLDVRGFDHILFGNETESYPLATRPHFVASLLPHFPQEEAALKAYLALITDTAAQFPLYNLRYSDGSAKTGMLAQELMATLRSLTKNERLVQVLAGNNMLYAGVDGQTPFYVHAMSTDGYLHSVHKAIPGSSVIAKALWRELQRYGGELHRHMEVKHLHEAGGTMEWAQTADGQRWEATQFICAINPVALFSLTDSTGLRAIYRQRVTTLPQTPPGLMVNLVFKPNTVPYKARNIYWHPSGEALGKKTPGGITWPDTQALFFNEDASAPGFAESVTLLVYVDATLFSEWSSTENIAGVQKKRTAEYEGKKEAYADAILEKTFSRFPEMKDAVSARSIATPLTLRDYTGVPDGSLYGALKDVSRPGQSMLGARTKIRNLFLTGQALNMHGVMGVSISALATCGSLLGMDYLIGRIRQATTVA